MPYELRDLAPALEYAGRHPEAGFALLRSFQSGLRPGLAAIVDDPERVTAVMLVHRPDWRKRDPLPTHIQLDAETAGAALRLLAWVPPGAEVRLTTYRPWLHELALGVLEGARTVQHVLCVADAQRFRPDPGTDLAVEIGADQVAQAGHDGAVGPEEGDRLFGVVREGRLLACAALGPPENGYAPVRCLFPASPEGRQGCGAAALSAAVQAALQAGHRALCRLPASELPLLHLAARLGLSPVCREWSAEGRVRR